MADDCFGRHWDPNDVECRGGHDPCYVHPRNQTHVRDRCVHYTDCARRTSESQVQQSQQPYQQQPMPYPQPQLIPVQQVLRPQLTPTYQRPYTGLAGPAPQPQIQPVVPLKQMLPPAYQNLYNQVQQQNPQWANALAAQMAPPSMAQWGPQMVPMNFQWPGMQMPGYLTVPEPVQSNPWYVRLGHEVIRAMLKSAFHQGANFFDHNTFRPYPQPVLMQHPTP
jgi:hypothetical protein